MEKDLIKITFTGHVDHGKSTLIGRMLYETGNLPPSKYEQIKKMSRTKKTVEFGYILDAFEEEQKQGVTIDVARIYFKTKNRNFLIIDAPGHKEFLKNMVSGSSTADVAVILIDAAEKIKEQSKRHAYVLSFLGIRKVIVVINKMDKVNYSKKIFDSIKNDYTGYLKKINLTPVDFIPVSAQKGGNVVKKTSKLKWFKGKTFIQALDSLNLNGVKKFEHLRFPVQDVYKFDDRRIIAGKIEAGSLKKGDKIYFWPSGKSTYVKTIETWPKQKKDKLIAGEAAAITTKDPLFIERGEVISRKENAPVVTDEFNAVVFWLADAPLTLNKNYCLKILTQKTDCQIINIQNKINSSTLKKNLKASNIKTNEAARVTIKTKNAVVFDKFDDSQSTGRFVIAAENGAVAGGGIITLGKYPNRKHLFSNIPESQNITFEVPFITVKERSIRFNHKPAVLWFTGLSASGKSTIAKNLEKFLFSQKIHTYVLDGDNVRHGLNADLGFSADDRTENIRRVGEVAGLFADAGFIVITAFISPYITDRQKLKEKFKGCNFYEIYIDCPLKECQKRDPKGLYKKVKKGEIENFTGITSPYEPPENPDLVLNTKKLNLNECVKKTHAFLIKKKII